MTLTAEQKAWLDWLERVVSVVKTFPKLQAVYRGRFSVFPAIFLIGDLRRKDQKALHVLIDSVQEGRPAAFSVLFGETILPGTVQVWKRDG